MRKVKYPEMGKRIKDARIAAGFKQKDCLAKLGDVTAQMLSDWENGYVCPSLTYLVNIAKFYNVSLDYIVLGIEKGSENKQITTYKDAILSMVRLEDCGLFEISSTSDDRGEKIIETLLITEDKTICQFKRDFAKLYAAQDTMKKELYQQALSELIEKYNLLIK